MVRKKTLVPTALAAAAFACFFFTTARALDRDEQMQLYHIACDHGDRRACIHFGIILGENHERHDEWRRTHPEYFWWEH